MDNNEQKRQNNDEKVPSAYAIIFANLFRQAASRVDTVNRRNDGTRMTMTTTMTVPVPVPFRVTVAVRNILI